MSDPSEHRGTPSLEPELEELRRQFMAAPEFEKSPLYTALGQVVATHPPLLRLAARARRGQYPTFLFFGAIHYILLGGARHELAEFYPSIAGDRARPPRDAGPTLLTFCETFEEELATLIKHRLVQTNAVPRSLALKLGFFALGRRSRTPVHLIEIGASAGIHLRFDRYGYALGRHRYGNPNSPVQISADWLADAGPPDLDAAPPLASVTGVDLNPLDATRVEDRRWLEALVWPDNPRESKLLHQALDVIATDPPPIRRGDATVICPQLATTLPPAQPRLVFTAATRMHIPIEQRDEFDTAIDTLGQNAPLYHLTLEHPVQADPRPQPARLGGGIHLRDPMGTHQLIAIAGHRLDWIDPIEL